MGCVAGLVGFHQAAAETTVVADVPQETVLAGLVVVLPSSAASCAAATKGRYCKQCSGYVPRKASNG
jgi:hypothetical protein